MDPKSNVVYIPGDGFGSKSQIKNYENLFVTGNEETVSVNCILGNLDEDQLFSININDLSITINKNMIKGLKRNDLLNSYKLSIFLLTKEYFGFTSLKKNHIQELNDLNKYLIEAI